MTKKASESRSQTMDGVTYKYSSDWIHQLENQEHWMSYHNQLSLILPELKAGDTILEIGPGSGFLSNYLRSKGYQVSTLDIDDEKSPDITANLVDYPFPEKYDHIMAFEVFEHIPFDKFEAVLPKLKNAVVKNLFLSVPRNYRIWFRADLIIPYFKNVSFSIKMKRRKINEGHHFWEMDFGPYKHRKLAEAMGNAGFSIASIKKISLMVFIHLRPNP